MNNISITSLALCTAILVISTGCATSAPRSNSSTAVVVQYQKSPSLVVIKKRPPARRAEVRPFRPTRRHVWVDGYWRWNGSRYTWAQGRWTVPPRGRTVWVRGFWQQQNGGWVFIAGRWR